MSFLLFLALLAVMAVARLAELWVAKRYTQAARARGEGPRREPIFILMVALHTMPFWMAPLEVAWFDRPFLPWLGVATFALLVVALVARVWTLGTLGRRWNVRIVKPDAIVTEGPYRFIRHPNYAIVIIELLAMPLFHGAWITCIAISALNGLVLAFRIPAEERVLFQVPGYAEAMGDKPRFIPSFAGRRSRSSSMR